MKNLFLIICLFSLFITSYSNSELDFLLKDDDELFKELITEEKNNQEKDAVVEELKGEAYVKRDGNEKWLQLIKTDPIKDKDTIVTMENSELSIKMLDESYINIGEKSQLNFSTLSKTPKIEKLSETGFELAMGKIYSNIRNKMETGGKYFVDSGSIVAGVRGKKDANAAEDIEEKELKLVKAKTSNKKRSYEFNLEAGLVYIDNIKLNEEEESDIYFDTKLELNKRFECSPKLELLNSLIFENKTYSELTDYNQNQFEIQIEPLKKFTKWNISFPLSYSLATINSEVNNSDLELGIKGNREIRNLLKNYLSINTRERIYLTVGTDFVSTQNEEKTYKGSKNLLYSEIETKFNEIEIITGLELEFTDYDLESENYFSTQIYLSGEKLINEKYLVSGLYEFTLKDYQEYEIGTNHLISTGIESNILESNWKYLFTYSLEINNFDFSEYHQNNFSVKVKREFN